MRTKATLGSVAILTAAAFLLGSNTAAAAEPIAVTATVGAERVRFLAPSTVYQLRLEVYGAGGEEVFDSGLRFGNVLDWSLRDQGAQPFSKETLGCVLTARDLSGRVTRHWGALAWDGAVATWLEPAPSSVGAGPVPALPGHEAGELDAVGEVGDRIASSRSGAGFATTLLRHDGRGGLLASGSGGLSFRLGDYLAGREVERMRLTEQGNLGIGVKDPQAKLDVGGEIRTSEGIRFSDGTLQKTAAWSGGPTATKGGLTPVSGALVDGSGTANALAKWTSGTTIGNSTIVDVGGDIGVGTTLPGGVFDLQRGSNGDILQRFWNTGTGGAKLRYVAADAATSQVQLTDSDEWLAAIAADEQLGLQFRVRGTSPGDNSENGLASSVRMTIRRSGRVGIGTTGPIEDLHVKSGVGDFGIIQVGGVGQNGDSKIIYFGNVAYIGEFGEYDRLKYRAAEHRFLVGDVIPDDDNSQSLGTSDNRWSAVWAADGSINTSDARLKKEVVDLRYGLREVLQLRPVSYGWKDRADGRQHLGLIAQEVQNVLPEVVVPGSDPEATLGMSYSGLVPVLVKAIQEQQKSIEEQKASIAALAAENRALAAAQVALCARGPSSRAGD